MKTKYERMSRNEKKELYREYKKEKGVFASKMEKMFILCYAGIFYSLVVFIYDFFYKNSMPGYILDVVLFVFCLLALLKINLTKKELLNNYVLKKEREKKQKFLKSSKGKK